MACENPQTVCIAHMDLPGELWQRRRAGQRRILAEQYAPRLRAAGVRMLTAAVFVHPAGPPQGALACAMGQVGALYEELADCDGLFCLVRSGGQLDAALARGQIAVVLAMEGAEPLGNDAMLLRSFYELGVRLLGLTWNGRNLTADGCAVQGGGLTAFGRDVAEQAASLGMLLDVSHLNDAGFWDLLALEGACVMASHSNCRALCEHPRNLTDQQLRALAERESFVGLNQIRFLTEGPQTGTDGAAVASHARHMLPLLGPERVGLGVDLARDYMQALPKPRAFWAQYDPAAEDIWRDYADAAQLAQRLREDGCTPAVTAGILGENLLRFLRRHL